MHRFVCCLFVLGVGLAASAQDKDKDTAKAAATKKALESKISVDYKDTLLQDVLMDLAEKTKAASKEDIQFKRDPKGGATQNQKINYVAKEKTVKVVLDEFTKEAGLSWSVISGKYKEFGTKYDGFVFITK